MSNYAVLIQVEVEFEGEKNFIEQFRFFDTFEQAAEVSSKVFRCVDNVCELITND
jgi:hypothetical protein